MAKATPSKEELSKAIIINVFTTVIGICIGLCLNNMYQNYKVKKNGLVMPGMMPGTGL